MTKQLNPQHVLHSVSAPNKAFSETNLSKIAHWSYKIGLCLAKRQFQSKIPTEFWKRLNTNKAFSA